MRYYDYQCDKCDHIWEQLVDSSEERPPCPKCESKRITRLVSAAAGYRMSSGGSSTRPRSAGAFKRPKK